MSKNQYILQTDLEFYDVYIRLLSVTSETEECWQMSRGDNCAKILKYKFEGFELNEKKDSRPFQCFFKNNLGQGPKWSPLEVYTELKILIEICFF